MFFESGAATATSSISLIGLAATDLNTLAAKPALKNVLPIMVTLPIMVAGQGRTLPGYARTSLLFTACDLGGPLNTSKPWAVAAPVPNVQLNQSLKAMCHSNT